jgi:2-keto-4-pentenoate hydratase/2-oxohepta-3-ene-1,7-dioic acid hydratase in catechol pathway
MKFATFEHDGLRRVGLLLPDSGTICPIDAADLVEVIANVDALKPSLHSVTESSPLAEVRLLAPIPAPRRNIFCVGRNYLDHADEFSRSGYEAGARPGNEPDAYPAVFTKPASCVVGPDAPVPTHPDVTAAVDYEGEQCTRHAALHEARAKGHAASGLRQQYLVDHGNQGRAEHINLYR